MAHRAGSGTMSEFVSPSVGSHVVNMIEEGGEVCWAGREEVEVN